jgi:hypothetical protein
VVARGLAEVAPRLLKRELLRGIESVRYVESGTGRSAAYAHDQVSARLASADEFRELKLQEPAAVRTVDGGAGALLLRAS